MICETAVNRLVPAQWIAPTYYGLGLAGWGSSGIAAT
jgi:hypothetical protein